MPDPVLSDVLQPAEPWSPSGAAGSSSHAARIGMEHNLWPIAELRPTQMTVGWREVAEKRRRGPGAAPKSAPTVLGPNGVAYVLDRHHSLCALQLQGEPFAPVHVVEDLQHLSLDLFWRRLDQLGWCRPYDAGGRRRPFLHMPESLAELGDDPFRSLASALRQRGGYRKSSCPFSEFRWADHLRAHLSLALVEHDFEMAVEAALQLARRPEAASLPGAHNGRRGIARLAVEGADRA